MAVTKLILFSTSTIFFFATIDSVYVGYVERNRIPRVVKKFKIGSQHINMYMSTSDQKNFFPREYEENEITKLIFPSTPGFFNLITGEHGTGKTTLVRHVCKNTPRDVIYVRVPDDPTLLARTIGTEVDFDFEVHISFWSQLRRRFFGREDLARPSELNLVLDAISKASQYIAEKQERPTVLFIDNLTRLAKGDVPTFQRLIYFAKTEADNKNLVVNFVASEGHTPRQISELSESSRLRKVVEIGDLDERQAITFLTKSGVNETTAKNIYDIAGGRITLLTDARLGVQEGQTLKDIQNTFVQRAGKEFGDLSLPKDATKLTEKQKEAWKLIIAICDSPNKEISYTDFQESLGSASLADEFLQRNIFAYHHVNNTVSLQSRPIELFVEQKRQLFESNIKSIERK